MRVEDDPLFSEGGAACRLPAARNKPNKTEAAEPSKLPPQPRRGGRLLKSRAPAEAILRAAALLSGWKLSRFLPHREVLTGKFSLRLFPCGAPVQRPSAADKAKNRPPAVGRLSFFFIFGLFSAEPMDIRVVAKLIRPRIGEKPADLDQLLESMGLRLTWVEKLQLLQLLPGVEAVYHAVSGRILVRRA